MACPRLTPCQPMLAPLLVSERKNPFGFIPTAKAGDQVAVETKFAGNADHAGVAFRDAHNHHLATDLVEHVAKDGLEHLAAEPARVSPGAAHFDNTGLGLVVVEHRSADQSLVLDNADGNRPVKASFTAGNVRRDPCRDGFAVPIEQVHQTTSPPVS